MQTSDFDYDLPPERIAQTPIEPRGANKFAQLIIDRSHGRPAPHKPILLLSIIELIERGVITSNEIELTPEIVSTFLN